jgi:LPPG:FO 2-phospho-L-lactate transferase
MSVAGRVVLLVGGVGGAKLACGLARILPPEALTIVVNTADDFRHLGLHVSPDLDTVMYTLADLANPETGWGVAGDSFRAMEMLAGYDGPTWFRLGDVDLATHLARTAWLDEGLTLTQVTARLCERLGIRHTLLPVTDDPLATRLDTDEGELTFQVYFVARGWQPVVRAVRYVGADQAHIGAGVARVLEEAGLIVLGPSNPVLSIDPILAVPGVRERIIANSAPCVAISPIIGGRAVRGPAAKLMAELGMDVSPAGIARHYGDLLSGIILDEEDRALADAIEAVGVRAFARRTLMLTDKDKVNLAQALLTWAEGVAT